MTTELERVVMHRCHYCDCTTDLRPYGPKGALVCFPCAMREPDRKREAERQFADQLSAIDGPACIDGSEAGVYPAKHGPEEVRRKVHNA